MNRMEIVLFWGIQHEGFHVVIRDEKDHEVFYKEYSYGWNVSHSRRNAEAAHNDVVRSKKYGWEPSSYICEKPFVTDLIQDLINDYNVEKWEVLSGSNLFTGLPCSDADVEYFIDRFMKELEVEEK